jgi:hypothetical protein
MSLILSRERKHTQKRVSICSLSRSFLEEKIFSRHFPAYKQATNCFRKLKYSRSFVFQLLIINIHGKKKKKMMMMKRIDEDELK